MILPTYEQIAILSKTITHGINQHNIQRSTKVGKDVSLVRVTTEVSKECRKQLRILAIQKDMTLSEVINDVLERAMSKKMNQLSESGM